MKRTSIRIRREDIKFDGRGLVPVIAQDHENGDVLMMAWMDWEALSRTISTGRMTYWSRSRQAYWVKGETSGNHQRMIELSIDCDRDCILAKVDQTGPACHEGKRSCFFTDIDGG